jgi:hypothetical protein
MPTWPPLKEQAVKQPVHLSPLYALALDPKKGIQAKSKAKPQKPQRLAGLKGIAYSGGPMWGKIPEEGPEDYMSAYDLESLVIATPTPVLIRHDQGRQAGWALDVDVVDGELVFGGWLMIDDHGIFALEKSEERPWKASICCEPGPNSTAVYKQFGDIRAVNGKSFQEGCEVRFGWHLREISLVPKAADQGTVVMIEEY